jgi:DNA polymerase I
MKKSKRTKKRVLIIDGNNYLMRAGFATSPMSNKKGFPTNAIRGFFNILLADIYHLNPSHLIVTFDRGGKKNWRKIIYPEYKGNRNKEPNPAMDEIFLQQPYIKKLLRYIGIRSCQIKGVEADDLIGTLALYFEDLGFHVVIASKDKDFAQLVTPNVNMLVAESRNLLDEDGIFNKFGVYPSQIIDFLALQGDGSDNIPGIHKCGGKTAAKLLSKYKNLKGVVKNRKELTPALQKNLNSVKHLFPLTTKLLTIKTDFSLKTNESNSELPSVLANEDKYHKLIRQLELTHTSNQILRMVNKK